MRILFLSKRRYMSKDVIADRYARLYELPYQLARRGHSVLACCLSYQANAEGSWDHDAGPGQLEWCSSNLGRTVVPGLGRYLRNIGRRASDFKPDLVIGASDIPHCILAWRFAQKLGVPYALDLYDNFESYGQARLPGFRAFFRMALRRAALVSCVSEPLAGWVRGLGGQAEVLTLHSTVDKSVFHPRDRLQCRRELGLPAHCKLIGTAGALHRDKGIVALYRAFERLGAAHPDLHLVLAGPADASLPQGPRIHYLGQLPHQSVASLFSALDVGVICVPDTPFGRYSFPQKAYEMVACGIPLVAADVGAMTATFAGVPHALFRRDDAASLAEQIEHQLRSPAPASLVVPGWDDLAAELEQALLKLRNPARRSG
jgi:teichuronic acid biosynthesis glycosyltransferase TuaC